MALNGFCCIFVVPVWENISVIVRPLRICTVRANIEVPDIIKRLASSNDPVVIRNSFYIPVLAAARCYYHFSDVILEGQLQQAVKSKKGLGDIHIAIEIESHD